MSQDGVKDLMLSGLRATVFMEEGKKLEEEAVKTALKEKGMTFKGMTAKKMPKPKAEFVLAVTGNT